jgi:antagonist of KipI
MSEEVLQVLEPGLLTSVQDLGREGYQSFVIPPSGAMDSFALRLGNLLVGNPDGEAGIEMTLMGAKFKVLKDWVISFTGGDMPAKVNDIPLPRWQSTKVTAGDVLSFSLAKKGCRGYLCLAGGIDVPMIMGSKSTFIMGRMGGYRGRALRKGDRLKANKHSFSLEQLSGWKVKPDIIPSDKLEKEIRIVLGPQDDYVAQEGIDNFFGPKWRVSSKANRMGYRFEGGGETKFSAKAFTDIGGPDPSNIIDDGIPLGGIQIPGGIEPISLLVDGPSAGGFVKIGCVIRPDIDRLGQAKTGDQIKFKKVSAEEAAQILKDQLALADKKNLVR